MEAEGNPYGENCVRWANTGLIWGRNLAPGDGRMGQEGGCQGDVVRVMEGASADSWRGTFRCSVRQWLVDG